MIGRRLRLQRRVSSEPAGERSEMAAPGVAPPAAASGGRGGLGAGDRAGAGAGSEAKHKAGRGRAAGRAATGPCLSAAVGERRVGGSGGATARRGPVP